MVNCIYCKVPLSEGSVIDFCQKCGINAFGAKMFKVIVAEMQAARSRGDLDQGSVR